MTGKLKAEILRLMPEEKSLPLPDDTLPKPEKDLPLPEKEITDGNEPETGTVVSYQNPNYEKSKNNLTGKVILTIFLLIFLYPIGIILMWFKTNWPKWLKFLLTIPLILGILGLIMGGFFISKITSNDVTVKTPPSSIQVSTPTPTPEIIPLPTLTASEAATWKTYKNNYFSLKYPESWILEKDRLTSADNSASVYIESDSFEDLTKQTENINIIIVDNIKSIEGKGFTGEAGSVNFDQVVISKNNKLFALTLSSTNPGILTNEDAKIFHQILSTFKFTDSGPQTSIQPTGSKVACTMEAKLCPDGVTYVSRVGPKCEFEKCPSE